MTPAADDPAPLPTPPAGPRPGAAPPATAVPPPAPEVELDFDLDLPASGATAPLGPRGHDAATEVVNEPGAVTPPARLHLMLPPGHRLQEFEVRGPLGQGGFSIVYRAWDHALRREVALKEYLPASLALRRTDLEVVPLSDAHRETFDIGRRSFVEEGVTLAKFDHPALVRVYRNFEAHGTAYMVMQLVEGETLDAAALRLPQPVDEGWLLNLLDPLTTALHVVHRARIVHRDIAPDNIMLLKDTRQPLLLDFGAARQVIGDTTQHPTAILKPCYAPIEQYPESGIVQGAHTDIYALAGVIHRLLTGTAPPNAQSRMLRDSYQPLSERLAGRYSASLLRAVDHALAVQPGQRPADIPAFRRELGLDDLLAGRPAVAAPPADPAPTAPPPAPAGRARARPRPRAWGLGALVAAAAVAGALGVNSGRRSSPPADAAAPAGSPTSAPASPTSALAAPPPAAPADSTAAALDQLLQAAAPELPLTLSLDRSVLKAGQTPLTLHLTARQAGYYHVLLHDTDGEVRLLYPAPGQPPGRLQAGQPLQLPPAVVDPSSGLERLDHLLLTEPTGPARLVALVTPLPLDWSALRQGSESDPQRLRAVRPTQTGTQPFYLGQPLCPAGQDCGAVRYGAAQVRLQVVP